MLPILCHRRNKADKGSEHINLFKAEDFDIVNKVTEGFSEKKKEIFFDKPVLAFAFAWYATDVLGKEFATKKFNKPNHGLEYVEEMQKWH